MATEVVAVRVNWLSIGTSIYRPSSTPNSCRFELGEPTFQDRKPAHTVGTATRYERLFSAGLSTFLTDQDGSFSKAG